MVEEQEKRTKRLYRLFEWWTMLQKTVNGIILDFERKEKQEEEEEEENDDDDYDGIGACNDN